MSAVATADIPRGTFPQLEDVPLDLVDVGDNIRVDPGELDELTASIEELGVLQPVKVTSMANGRYRLLWGQRRVLASRQAGLETIPAIIDAGDDVLADPGPRRSIEQLAENLQRKDLNPIEEAVALRAVLDATPDLTQVELAKRLGRSAPWVSNTLRLLDTASEVQDRIRTGELSASHGKAIAALPAKQQGELVRIVVNSKMSAHQLEREIQWKQDTAKNDEARARKTEKWIPKAIAALEAAEIAKDAGVQVTGGYYDTDVDAVRRAVQKAGWKLSTGGSYGYRGDRIPKGCDCTVVELQIGGRKAEITRVCVNSRHVDRQVNLDHRERKAQEERRGRQIKVLRDAFEREVRATAIPYKLIELTAQASSGYGGSVRVEDAYTALAANVFTDWRMRDLDLGALIAELGLQDPEKPIEASAPKQKAKSAQPAFSPAAVAAARRELDLDGDD